jgi:signal transduction histidine kinase
VGIRADLARRTALLLPGAVTPTASGALSPALASESREWTGSGELRVEQAVSTVGEGTAAQVSPAVSSPVFSSTGLAGCVIALAFAGLLLAMRIRSIRARRRTRAEARIAERERLARQLHDSLLQNVQGLVLHFQAVADCMQTGDPARDRLDAVLKRADGIIIEGRNSVRNLGPEREEVDLPRLIEAQAASTSAPDVAVRVHVQGRVRRIPPLVASELYRMAGELLVTATRDARAANIEVRLRYRSRDIELSVRDDGSSSTSSDADHRDLSGIRRRADRMQARMAIVPLTRGSLVSVTVAAPYLDPEKTGALGRVRRLLRKDAIDE